MSARPCPEGVVVHLAGGVAVPAEVAYLRTVDEMDIWETTARFDLDAVTRITIDRLPARSAVQLAR